MKHLTASLEDYLEVIYILSKNGGNTGITDVSKALSLSEASVNRAVNTLKEENLVTQEKYGKISLTPSGKTAAKTVYSRHKALMDFLIKVLEVNPQTAEDDACKIEHILSTETMKKIMNFKSK